MDNLVVLTEHLSVVHERLRELHTKAHSVLGDAPRSSTVSRPRQRQRRFTRAEATSIAKQYQAGASMNRIAADFGVHRRTIAHCLQAGGIAIRQLGLPPESVESAAALYRAGWSLARIAEKYGTTDMSVRRALTEHGVRIRQRKGWSNSST